MIEEGKRIMRQATGAEPALLLPGEPWPITITAEAGPCLIFRSVSGSDDVTMQAELPLLLALAEELRAIVAFIEGLELKEGAS
jgi:hypothetical protein